MESLFTEKEGYISKEKYTFYFINTETVKLSSTLVDELALLKLFFQDKAVNT